MLQLSCWLEWPFPFEVSNLHVFHHSIVPIASWSVFKFYPSIENAMYPFINTIVHVIMYVYYTMASFGPQVEPYLGWKKYLTALQLVQFLLIIVHSVRAPFIGCPLNSVFVVLISVLLGGIFFYLFYCFYQDNYCHNNNSIQVKNLETKGQSSLCPDISKLSNVKYRQFE